MAAGFSVLSESEVDDFHSSIKQLGFKVIDFELSETSAPLSNDETQVIAGTVTVIRKGTGSTRTYRAGHGSAWPVSFHDELKNGVFGAP